MSLLHSIIPRSTRERLPNRRAHTLLNIEAGGFRYVAGIGHYDDGRLAEIFLSAKKGGTAIDDAARDFAVVASLALQHGVDPDTLRHALMRNGSGEPSGPLGVLLDSLAGNRKSLDDRTSDKTHRGCLDRWKSEPVI